LAQKAPAASFPAEEKGGAAPAPAATPPAATAPPPDLDPTPPPPPAAAAPPSDSPSVVPPIDDSNLIHRDTGPYVSVTFSPLHLLSPIFELQIEGRVIPHFGVAVIGGIGSITAKFGTSSGEVLEQKFSAFELGGQLIGYPLQPFESLQLGAELLYINVGTKTFQGQEVKGNAGGFAIGPLVGYKLLTKVGFTFFVQGGFEYVAIKSDASDNNGTSVTEKQSAFIPLLNLNLGWSF
jgi:hypothetical protein